MNCPSRTDDTLLHFDWNQNPPLLAPDLTTRQDLNGISNVREHKQGIGLNGLPRSAFEEAGITTSQSKDPKRLVPLNLEASLTQSGRLRHPMAIRNIGHHSTYYRSNCQSLGEKLRSWALWFLSVLITSAIISHKSLARNLGVTKPSAPSLFQGSDNKPLLVPRKGTCASGGVSSDEYNTSLHVGALFIILAVSFLSCAFPVLAIRFPRLRIPSSFLFCVSHFGTGVLIATAFVHLLPTAFTSLNDPCLSGFWTTDYPQMPGAIALAGIFFVTVVEMVFSPSRHCCRMPAQICESSGTENVSVIPRVDITDHSNPQAVQPLPSGLDSRQHLRNKGSFIGRSSSISRAINKIGEDADRICRIASAPEGRRYETEYQAEPIKDSEQNSEGFLSSHQKHRKEIMQVYMLEMGILFHSVFIGMSLSVSIGSEFVILLIAIVFHQTFEGLALGSRIAVLSWPEKAWQPWLMSLVYGCTTPIGQAIGLATHSLYSPDSEVGLLLVGIMNAISAGLLIFASLIELMSEDFLSDESWRILRGRKRVCACILVFLGAFCMSVVGAFA
ncbi:ZIP zinc transporter-domain-containing protein [Aspergillus ambiguus]|uniref:putative plasma membrane zinc ion transporter n=1 Tax=Aspergillus ambiguus TaxID=176160 RepID=UPI003CCCA507